MRQLCRFQKLLFDQDSPVKAISPPHFVALLVLRQGPIENASKARSEYSEQIIEREDHTRELKLKLMMRPIFNGAWCLRQVPCEPG